jgi:hypothetical protein
MKKKEYRLYGVCAGVVRERSFGYILKKLIRRFWFC